MRNETSYIVPLNLSKLGYRYFRIIIETKLFSKKFIQHVANHPNTGFVFEGFGWSGKKRVLGIGIWATTNAEMADIASNIRSIIPDAYKIVYQSELTRLEYFRGKDRERKRMIIIDELDQAKQFSALELDYLKLISVDGGLSMKERAAVLNIEENETEKIDKKLKGERVFYSIFKDSDMPVGYTKFFVDTASLGHTEVEHYIHSLRSDSNCIYIARGNGKYNLEFEYVIVDEKKFETQYGHLCKNSKRVVFDKNIYTNLFPQSKSLHTKLVRERFVNLAKASRNEFDFTQSELWYVNHAGTQGYLDIYKNETYREAMKTGEIGLFSELANKLSTRKEARFNIIDLGSGDGQKGREFAKQLGEERVRTYFPVDIQELELSQAVRAHHEALYAVHPTFINFKNLSARFPLASADSDMDIYAIFGGTYGNFASQEINSYLSEILKYKKDKLLVSVQVSDYTDRMKLQNSYRGEQMQSLAFGVLKHIGFKLDEFESNKGWPELKLHAKWKEDKIVTYFVLKNNKFIHGVHVEAGTRFEVTSSWKPTLECFRKTLEEAFEVEDIVCNESTAIAICGKK